MSSLVTDVHTEEHTKLWTREEFISELMKVGAERYHDKHPFNVRMNEGRLSVAELQAWVANRFYYQINIPIKDAIILSKLPSSAERRVWIRRIIIHDGTADGEGGIESWIRLGEAVMLTREQLQSGFLLVPGVRFAVDGYVNYCRLQPWLLCVASSLTEMFAADAMAERIACLKKHSAWIKPGGLEYFERRLQQAPKDVDDALNLVLEHATTRVLQEEVVAAVRFKCDVLWCMLDALDQLGHV